MLSSTRSPHQQWSSSYSVSAHVPAHRHRLSLVVVAVVGFKQCDGCGGRVDSRVHKPVGELDLGNDDAAVGTRAWLPVVAVYHLHHRSVIAHRHVIPAFPLRTRSAVSTSSGGARRQTATSRQHEAAVVRWSAAERWSIWLRAGTVQLVHAVLTDIARRRR